MSIPRTAFRAMIFYDYKRQLGYQQSHENLTAAFGDAAPSLSAVSHWFREFRRGRELLEDEARPGRPAEAACSENVDRVASLIQSNRNITYREIQEEVKIGSSAVNTILHKHLGVRKLASRWIPHLLSESQKQDRVDWCKFMLQKFDGGASKQVAYIVTGDESWVYSYDPETKQQSSVWVFEDEDLPTKVIRGRSVNKKMIAVFFRRSGPVAVIPLEDRRTVNSEWYCEVALPQMFAKLQTGRQRTGLRNILVHHDNASSHTAARTLDFLKDSGVQLVTHPPYSPDLAPCDFFLFPTVKKMMRGKRFSSADAAVTEFQRIFEDLSENEFSECFKKWFQRMHKCISLNGEYFEKQ